MTLKETEYGLSITVDENFSGTMEELKHSFPLNTHFAGDRNNYDINGHVFIKECFVKALKDANCVFKNKIPINLSEYPAYENVSSIGKYAYVSNIDLDNQTAEVVFRYKDVYDKVMEYHKEIRVGGEYIGIVESNGVCKINKILAFRLLTNYWEV